MSGLSLYWFFYRKNSQWNRNFFLRYSRSTKAVPGVLLNFRHDKFTILEGPENLSGKPEVTSLLLIALGFLCHLSWCLGAVVPQVLWSIWLPFVFLISHELRDICVACYLNFSGMIDVLYLDVNAFVFFISQADLVYFFNLSFVAVAGGCLGEGQGNLYAPQRRKRRNSAARCPIQPPWLWPQRDIYPFLLMKYTAICGEGCSTRKVLYKCWLAY